MQHVFVSGQTDEESKEVLRELIARLQGATSKQEKQVHALPPSHRVARFEPDLIAVCVCVWRRTQKQIDGELDKLLRDISPSGAGGGNGNGGGRASGSLGSKAGAKVAATLLSEKSGAKLGILPAQKMVSPDLEQSQREKRTVKIEPPEEITRSTSSSPNSPSSSSTSLSEYERKAKEENSEEHRIKLSRRRSAPPTKKAGRFRRSGDQLFGLCDECSLSTEVRCLACRARVSCRVR